MVLWSIIAFVLGGQGNVFWGDFFTLRKESMYVGWFEFQVGLKL